jgi:hypothetical protein
MQKWEWQQLDTQSNTILFGTASLWNNGCSTAIIPSQQPPTSHSYSIIISIKINLQAALSLKTHSKL